MSTDFTVGSKVRIITLPPYVKTSDSIPMLRPPDVIKIGEVGIVLDRRPGNYWSVKFTRGAFLMESQYLESAE
jgi:hypothetical protein